MLDPAGPAELQAAAARVRALAGQVMDLSIDAAVHADLATWSSSASSIYSGDVSHASRRLNAMAQSLESVAGSLEASASAGRVMVAEQAAQQKAEQDRQSGQS